MELYLGPPSPGYFCVFSVLRDISRRPSENYQLQVFQMQESKSRSGLQKAGVNIILLSFLVVWARNCATLYTILAIMQLCTGVGIPLILLRTLRKLRLF